MADPISDVQGLFDSFANMAGGLKQLHDIRVQAQVAKESAEWDKAEHDYLARFYLPLTDGNRLTPENWRPAFQELEAKKTARLAESSGDPRIRASIEQQLGARRTRFSLDVQAALAQAELQLAEETTLSTIKTQFDSGNRNGAYATFDKAKASGLLSPAKADAWEAELITPYRAQDEYEASVAASKGSLIRGMEAFAEKDIKSQSLRSATLSIFNAKIRQNDEAMNAEVEATVKKALDAGYASEASGHIDTILKRYEGNVSSSAITGVMGLSFDARKGVDAAAMDSVLGHIESTAGAVYEGGKLIAGSKKISAADGFVLLKEYESLFAKGARGNEDLAAQYETNVGKIRALIAEGKAGEDEVFESYFNTRLTKYFTKQGVTGKDLMGDLFRAAPYLSTETFDKYRKKLENGEFLSEDSQKMLDDPQLFKTVAQAVSDGWTFNGKEEKVILAFNKAMSTGDFSHVDAIALGAYQTAISVFKAEVANGGNANPAELQGKITLAIRGYMDHYNAGAFDQVLEGASKGSLNKHLGQRIQSLPDIGYDFYGNAYEASMRQAVVKAAAPIAGDLVRAVDGSITDKQELVMVWGPDNDMYVVAKGKDDKLDSWRRTAYKVWGNSSGLTVTPLTFSTTEYDDLLDTIRINGDSKAVTVGSTSAAATILYSGDKGSLDTRTPTEKRADAKEAVTRPMTHTK